MEVKDNSGGNTGIDIYTSESNDFPKELARVKPHKNPYIVFTYPSYIPYPGINALFEKFKTLGLNYRNSPKTIIIITSHRKVKEAIDLFLAAQPDQSKNSVLIEHLKKLRTNCENEIAKKLKKSTPPTGKNFSKFQIRQSSLRATSTSTHKTIWVEKKSSKKPGSKKAYVFKKIEGGRTGIEFEVANSLCFRLLLNDRHPKIFAAYGDENERVGVLSEEIESFTSMGSTIDENKLTKDLFLQGEVSKVYGASLVEEEPDLHVNNYGFNKQGYCVKIDDDRATWPLTAKYVGSHYNSKRVIKEKIYPAPIEAFPLTQPDITEFPITTDAQPDHPFYEDLYHNIPKNSPIKQQIKDWFTEQKAKDDAYYIFLKRALIPDRMYAAISTTINSPSISKKFYEHKIARTKELRKELLINPTFQNYLERNPQAIDTIIEEFKKYNEDFNEKKYPNFRFSKEELNKIRKDFQDNFLPKKNLKIEILKDPIPVPQQQKMVISAADLTKAQVTLNNLPSAFTAAPAPVIQTLDDMVDQPLPVKNENNQQEDKFISQVNKNLNKVGEKTGLEDAKDVLSKLKAEGHQIYETLDGAVENHPPVQSEKEKVKVPNNKVVANKLVRNPTVKSNFTQLITEENEFQDHDLNPNFKTSTQVQEYPSPKRITLPNPAPVTPAKTSETSNVNVNITNVITDEVAQLKKDADEISEAVNELEKIILTESKSGSNDPVPVVGEQKEDSEVQQIEKIISKLPEPPKPTLLLNDLQGKQTKTNQTNSQNDSVVAQIEDHEEIPPLTIVKKPSLFEESPWAKDLLIGVGVGLVVVAAVIIIAFSWGAALPAIFGAGFLVGTTVGLSGGVAAGFGLAALGAGVVGLTTFFTMAAGKISRLLCGEKNTVKDPLVINGSNSDMNKILHQNSNSPTSNGTKVTISNNQRLSSMNNRNAMYQPGSTVNKQRPAHKPNSSPKKGGSSS